MWDAPFDFMLPNLDGPDTVRSGFFFVVGDVGCCIGENNAVG